MSKSITGGATTTIVGDVCGNYLSQDIDLLKILESVERGQTAFYIAGGNGPDSKTSRPRKDGNSARIACPVFFGGGKQTFFPRVAAQLGLTNRSRARARHKTDTFKHLPVSVRKVLTSRSFLCLGVFRESIRSGEWRYIRTSAQSRPCRITCSRRG